jgi:hypothetical protein
VIAILGIFWKTMGLAGAASGLASIMAAALLATGGRLPGRLRRFVRGTATAAVACVLAAIATAQVRSIEVDRAAETRALEARAQATARERLRGRAAAVRFAEDTAADQADVAGVSVAEEQGAYERAVAEQLAALPAYRRRGLQQRSGKATTGSGTAAPDASGEAGDPAAAETVRPRRMLPQAELTVADRFDRGNRIVAWSVLGVAIAVTAYEYLRRFHTTFDAAWPVPLAGTAVDGLFPKEHVATAAALADSHARSAWLGDVVRKGESFIVFADADPLAGRGLLPRLGFGRLGIAFPVRTLPAETVRTDVAIAETVFESAWFGRAAFVLTGRPGAADVLCGIGDALRSRHRCRAAARRTLDIVWLRPEAPPASVAAEIVRLAQPMNLRFVVGGRDDGA